MENIVKEFRLGELFCGPGGLALGATTAEIADPEYRIIHKWANDYDLDTCHTYTRNICPTDAESVMCGDVRKLDIDKLGAIDALAFGFPCNDFSVVGEQKGFDGVKDWEVLKPRLEKSNNGEYWVSKISRNRERDDEINKKLLFEGWTVIRFWENDIKKHTEECVKVVEETVFELQVET